MKPLNQSEGFSKEELDRDIKESLISQYQRENTNPLLGISPLFLEWHLYNFHYAPYKSYILPTSKKTVP